MGDDSVNLRRLNGWNCFEMFEWNIDKNFEKHIDNFFLLF
jgi:hypothetical protein